MSFFSPSILYVHYKTFFKIIELNVIQHFSIRRLLFTLLFVVLHSLLVLLLVVGRILDEIFFRGYRKIDISNPVFIISNPRCGTTFLHRLLSLDKNRYTSTLLYHTIFPCVTYIKLIQGIAYLDSKIGGPLNWFFRKLDRLLFGGWKDIHPMGFNETEEDEALFAIMSYTPSLILLTPWASKIDYMNFLDSMDDDVKREMKAFYMSSLKRITYATNADATLLIKNVFSTGRLHFIIDCFPNAKIIYPVRHPYKAVPSVISMFRGPWKVHSPEIAEDSEESRDFGKIAIDYYAYLFEQKEVIDKKNLLPVAYTDVVAKPKESAYKIYEYFGFEMEESFKIALESYTLQSKKYKSKHSYSMAQYGITKEAIYQPLVALMEEFNLDKDMEV